MCKAMMLFYVGTYWIAQIALLVRHDGDVTKQQGSHQFAMVPFLHTVEDIHNVEVSE